MGTTLGPQPLWGGQGPAGQTGCGGHWSWQAGSEDKEEVLMPLALPLDPAHSAFCAMD